jgi:sugar/nucleoside kinase (ribokinase family)
MPFDVVVVGEINADLILRGNVEPVFGQVEQLVDDANLVIGSSAAIFACGLARLGLRTTLIGKVGDDIFGKFMIDALNAKRVDTSGVIASPEISTGLSVILAKGEDRAILTYLGSIPAMNYSEIDLSLMSSSRHLHLGSFFMLDNLRADIPRLFQTAKRMGLTVSMDTNYDPAENWDNGLEEAIKYIDLLLPNDREAKAIAGENDLHRAMDILIQKVPLLAVKRGEQGGMVKIGSGKILEQRAISVEVVDTVGAGDSFDAGFIYGYLNRWDLDRTLKLAVSCGSLSTRKAGGTEAQAELAEATRFMKKMDD